MARKKLSERDAWALALAWREQLQGCVRLETEDGDARSLVPAFGWVAFVLNGAPGDGLREVRDARETALSARAATLAWFALSCCAGFGARENPHFWRRVFSELHAAEPPKRHAATSAKKPYPYRAQRPISDAVRFFDGAQAFPRVRFVAKFPQDGASARAFLESDGVDRKLQKLLRKVAPFVRASQRTVSVALEGLHVEELVKVVKSLSPESTVQPTLVSPSFPSPRFIVDSVVLRRQDTRCTAAIQELKALTRANIVAEECEFSHLFHTQRGPVESILRPLEGPFDHRASLFSVDSLSLARSIGSRTKFAVACSSLPLMPSLRAVDLTAKRFEVKGVGPEEWAWLGYAVFHPHASENPTFSHLDLRVPYVRDVAQHVRAFKHMAKGNNLVSCLGYNAPVSSAYFIARLRSGAIVRLDSADGATLEVELPVDSRCTLCGASKELSALDDWTQAVVPGYGLGWVMRDDLTDITAASPGNSCVRHLRLELPDVVNDDGELVQSVIAPMLDLLSVLGQNLVSLDMGGSLSMDKSTVRAILSHCPSLQILRISHDGAFWQDEASERATPRLKELELCVDATAGVTSGLKALRSSSLADLKVLRVQTLHNDTFEVTHRNFLVALATFPGILFGHWFYAGHSHFATYEKRRLHSLSLQRSMDCGQSGMSQVPMQLDCKLAFLSVARDTSMQESKLSLCGADVLRNVFSFSTSPKPRSVYIGCD